MPSDWGTTARLLRRAGFGATGAQIDAAAAMGAVAWLDQALAADPGADAAQEPPPALPAPPSPDRGATRQQRQAQRQTQREGVDALGRWWLRRMIRTEHPLTEKLTFGWHEHFATSAAKVRDAPLLLAQNQRLRSQGRGRFDALATAMLTDPALMLYLDAPRNRSGNPNENLAREFLELFTLGHGGGYTEQDVKEGARALTGWRIERDGTASVVARRHDGGVKTVLGVSGRLDAAGFAQAVLRQPATATHVATRWWNRLACPQPPTAATLERLRAAYGTDGDLTALVRAVLTDPQFDAAAGSLVVTPVEWVVGAARALRLPTDDATLDRLGQALRALGQVPFYPPNVSGWPAGAAWLSTAAAQRRVQVAQTLAATGDLSPLDGVGAGGRVEAVAHLLGIPHLTPRTAAALHPLSATPRELVALALVSPEYLVN